MNLLQVRDYVRGLLGEETPSFWSNAFLNTCIQRSFVSVYDTISNQRRGYFETTQNITYVSGQELYTFAAVTVKVVLVERVDSLVPQRTNIRPIDITQKNDYGLQTGVDISPGSERYFVTGNSIGIAPIPASNVTAALKIWYVPTPTLPTADADMFPVELTDFHHECIAWGALIRAVVRDKQLLASLVPTWNDLKAQLKEDTTIRVQQEPPQIIDTDPFTN